MIAILGPPPLDFLQRSEKSRLFWDSNGIPTHVVRLHLLNYYLGNWKGAIPIPEITLDTAEQRLHGEEKSLFISFLRRMLRWKPEDRGSLQDIFTDEWFEADLIKSGDASRE